MPEELKRATGVLDELGDLRTYDYEAVCGAANDAVCYPTKYEIAAPAKMRCKDQDNVGACVAETLSQVSEAYFEKEMSEGHIYGAFRTNGTRGYGMVVTSALKDWCSISTVPRQYFDLLIEMPELQMELKKVPQLENLYQQYKISGYVSLSSSNKDKRDLRIKDALTGPANKYGLVAISNNFFGRSHCIWLIGWNDEKDNYIIKNSWGENWGVRGDGIGEIPKSEIDQVYMVLFEEPQLPFIDVKPDDWFFKHVKNMYFSGTMQGTSEDTFAPLAGLTRAEAAAIIDRLLEHIDKKFAVLSGVLNIKTEKELYK